MSNIWFSSDYHFFHNKNFVYEPRGFSNIEEMNKVIIEKHNSLVQKDDEVYILGDLMLNDNEGGLNCIKQLNGHLHIILGNHCTPTREQLYKTLSNVEGVQLAAKLKYKGYHFFMTHYPCITGNLEKESLKQMTLNLSGHTHSKEKFYQNMPFVYNVAVDAHDCYPVHIDQIIEDMKAKVEECKSML